VLRDLFKGIYIANNGYDLPMAAKAREGNRADIVAFGRPWIANPDLIDRLQNGAELAAFNPDTLYGGGAAGYTDYPALNAA
jgi:N-ethylmaleimide reductase